MSECTACGLPESDCCCIPLSGTLGEFAFFDADELGLDPETVDVEVVSNAQFHLYRRPGR